VYARNDTLATFACPPHQQASYLFVQEFPIYEKGQVGSLLNRFRPAIHRHLKLRFLGLS